jgi:hypothetical protein
MKGGTGQFTTCFNCGTVNVTGVRSCINCGAPYYYNCPHCQTWVDNTFSDCPACQKKLNWPKEVYYEADIYGEGKSVSHAAVLLLLGIVLLSIVAINLITNNSNPVDAVSHSPGVSAPDTLPANVLKDATQPEIKATSLVAETPSMAQTNSCTYYPDTGVDYYYDTTTIYPVTPESKATADSYVPSSSSYLDSIYPNWGHCSGGSCRSTYQ